MKVTITAEDWGKPVLNAEYKNEVAAIGALFELAEKHVGAKVLVQIGEITKELDCALGLDFETEILALKAKAIRQKQVQSAIATNAKIKKNNPDHYKMAGQKGGVAKSKKVRT
jgi:hypothetical protein